jgi:thymidine kinase
MALELIIGSMYSGKSTELIHRVNRFRNIGMKCLVINHTNDTRVLDEAVQTHDGDMLPAKKTDDILLVDTRPYDMIAIDEGQFFRNLKTAVHFMVKAGKYVIVAGLNGDYQRNKFGEILDLIPIADNVTFKRALCKRCRHPNKEAAFTKRIGAQTGTVNVNCKYVAVCRQCYEK